MKNIGETMPNSGTDKRKVRDNKAGEVSNEAKSANKANVNCNILIDNYHGYAAKEGMKISVVDEDDFPSLPVTPTKPPPSKKGKPDTASNAMETNVVDAPEFVSSLAQLINTRSDKLESLIQENKTGITDLKKQIHSICEDVNAVKGKVAQVEQLYHEEKKRIGVLETRITDLERYSRRWNLRLNGIPETVENQQIRLEVIKICQAVLPEDKKRLPEVIDTVHRLGTKNPKGPRSVIIQFSSRVHRGAVWAAAKNSRYLRDHGLRFAEDLCQIDRENRKKLWPVVEAARKEGKVAFFVGGRCFIENKEIFSPQ